MDKNRHTFCHTYPNGESSYVWVDLSDPKIVSIEATGFPGEYIKEYCQWRKKIANDIVKIVNPSQLKYLSQVADKIIEKL